MSERELGVPACGWVSLHTPWPCEPSLGAVPPEQCPLAAGLRRPPRAITAKATRPLSLRLSATLAYKPMAVAVTMAIGVALILLPSK